MDPKHWLSLLWFVKHLGSLRQAHQQLLSTLHCHQTGLASWFTQGVGASLSCALRAPNTQQQWQRVYNNTPHAPQVIFFTGNLSQSWQIFAHWHAGKSKFNYCPPTPLFQCSCADCVFSHTAVASRWGWFWFSFQHCLSHSRGQGKRLWVSILGVFAYTVSTRFRLMTWSV